MVRTVIFRNGDLGIIYTGNTVIDVTPNSQAANLGVCVGWIIVKINDEIQSNDSNAIDQSLKKAKKSSEPLVVQFKGDHPQYNKEQSFDHTKMVQTIDDLSHKVEEIKGLIEKLENEGKDSSQKKSELINVQDRVLQIVQLRLNSSLKIEEQRNKIRIAREFRQSSMDRVEKFKQHVERKSSGSVFFWEQRNCRPFVIVTAEI